MWHFGFYFSIIFDKWMSDFNRHYELFNLSAIGFMYQLDYIVKQSFVYDDRDVKTLCCIFLCNICNINSKMSVSIIKLFKLKWMSSNLYKFNRLERSYKIIHSDNREITFFFIVFLVLMNVFGFNWFQYILSVISLKVAFMGVYESVPIVLWLYLHFSQTSEYCKVHYICLLCLICTLEIHNSHSRCNQSPGEVYVVQ